MIKFFRSIRKNMISENKTGNYIKYAIGEIVLVVIGILIALSINNWNELRKQINMQNSIYRVIKEDLINDISEFDSFVKDYKNIQKPAFNAILTKKLTKEDWEKNPNYIDAIMGFEDIAINQRGLNLLKSIPNLSNNIDQSLTSKINNFYDQHSVEINIAISELSEEFGDNLKNLKNYDWFSSFVANRTTDGFIDYYTNDYNAKNRIALYSVFYKIYVGELNNFKIDAETLVIDIDNYLNEN